MIEQTKSDAGKQKDYEISIRIANESDAGELLEIYRPYVENTAITFEYDVPSLQEFTARIHNIKQKYPYLAAVYNNEIVGYCYAGPFKDRAAYDWAVETSIYIKQDKKRMGIGAKLYDKLEEMLKKQGILNVNACIACPKPDSTNLTMDSIYFHEKLGYKMVGKFHDCGYKYNQWYDMVWLEKMIGSHIEKQPPIVSFSSII